MPRGPLMSRLAIGLIFLVATFLALGGFQLLKAPFGSAKPAPAQKSGRDEFAAERAPAADTSVSFDRQRAMGYLEAICKIGPRISATDGMKQQQELIKKHFEARGAKVEFQRFSARQFSQPQAVEMANL